LNLSEGFEQRSNCWKIIEVGFEWAGAKATGKRSVFPVVWKGSRKQLVLNMPRLGCVAKGRMLRKYFYKLKKYIPEKTVL
jgi:hypothetical protein